MAKDMWISGFWAGIAIAYPIATIVTAIIVSRALADREKENDSE